MENRQILAGKDNRDGNFYVASELEWTKNSGPLGELSSGDVFLAADASPAAELLLRAIEQSELKIDLGDGSEIDVVEAFSRVVPNLLRQAFAAGERNAKNQQ